MSNSPLTSLRRGVAARWDRLATDRAKVVVGRAARGSDANTTAAASDLVAASLRALPDASSWTPEQRSAAGAVAAQWLAAVVDGSVTPSAGQIESISAGFEALYQPTFHYEPDPPAVVERTITDQFHRLYYHRRPHTWERTWYRGHRIVKYPCDLWIYQTLIEELKPGLIIETGTRFGGSAVWLADQLDYHGHGRVVTIDINEDAKRPPHDRVTYLVGSSSGEEIGEQVRAMLPTDGSPVIAILDSDHSRDHVLAELQLFAPMITPGSYLIVEDTNINGRPVYPDFGPGPGEAVDEFLASTNDFVVDHAREMFYMSMHPGGFLRRRA